MLKNFLLILILLLPVFSVKAQNLRLQAEGTTDAETKIIDSVSYAKVHANAKSVNDEATRLLGTLFKNGYMEAQQTAQLKVNDSIFLYKFSLGSKTNSISIYMDRLTPEEKKLLSVENDTVSMPLNQVEGYMETTVALLERKGYSLSTLQLTNYKKEGNVLTASLSLKTEKKQRTLDGLVIEGYDKFPEGIRRNILRQYKGKVFNQENLQRIYNDFNGLRFVTQLRYPEILFKQDSTKVYVYLEKARPNTFDGFIGFANDENEDKIRFNGYIDLLLNNVLNSGEKFNLNWKNNGEEQTTFNVGLELPYIFKSPIGIKASLSIFKQDSTFQNTVTDLNVGYFFSYNSKVYLGYQQTQSVDIQNAGNSTISDYSNAFWTSTYQYNNYKIDDFLFPEKTSLFIKGGIGSRDSETGSTGQYFAQIKMWHNLYLNKRNIIHLKNESYYLDSDSYIISELYRFGGINSIRGFNENSLQANLYTALMAEYRYVLAPNLYVHTITDYGYFQDETSGLKDNLLGLGFGFGLLTKTGLFNLVYANGSTKEQSIKLSNSIVQLSFRTNF